MGWIFKLNSVLVQRSLQDGARKTTSSSQFQCSWSAWRNSRGGVAPNSGPCKIYRTKANFFFFKTRRSETRLGALGSQFHDPPPPPQYDAPCTTVLRTGGGGRMFQGGCIPYDARAGRPELWKQEAWLITHPPHVARGLGETDASRYAPFVIVFLFLQNDSRLRAQRAVVQTSPRLHSPLQCDEGAGRPRSRPCFTSDIPKGENTVEWLS